MVRLKPCPFCGAEPILGTDLYGRYDVRCLNVRCAVRPSTPVYETPIEASYMWNRRAEVKGDGAAL